MQQEETLEGCESRLHSAQQLLLDARPGAVDGCRGELQQVITLLEGLISEGAFQPNPPVSSALLRIRSSARALQLQIEYASNLWFGWIQTRLGEGYTAQGRPVLITSEPGSSFEG
jgi:hypothetical protein